jgi:hypothetical protein
MKIHKARAGLISTDRQTVTKLLGDRCSFVPHSLTPENASKIYRVTVIFS